MAESAEPYKEFIREMTLRIERVMRDFGREMRAMREENRRHFDLVEAELLDLREESIAQRQALLRLLDRLDGGGAAPA